MKKSLSFQIGKRRESLAGLSLSYVRDPLKPAKRGEDVYMSVERT